MGKLTAWCLVRCKYVFHAWVQIVAEISDCQDLILSIVRKISEVALPASDPAPGVGFLLGLGSEANISPVAALSVVAAWTFASLLGLDTLKVTNQWKMQTASNSRVGSVILYIIRWSSVPNLSSFHRYSALIPHRSDICSMSYHGFSISGINSKVATTLILTSQKCLTHGEFVISNSLLNTSLESPFPGIPGLWIRQRSAMHDTHSSINNSIKEFVDYANIKLLSSHEERGGVEVFCYVTQRDLRLTRKWQVPWRVRALTQQLQNYQWQAWWATPWQASWYS